MFKIEDKNKTKKQLISELAELRQQIAEYEKLRISQSQEQIAYHKARSYAENIIDTVREPLLVLDADLKILSANRSFYTYFKVTPEETIGNIIYDIGDRQWDIPELRTLIENILPQKKCVNFEVEHTFPGIGHKIMLLNARQIIQDSLGTKMILLAIEDITVQKQMVNELSESAERYLWLFETSKDGLLLLDKQNGEIINVNPAIVELMGYSREEFIGKGLKDVGLFNDITDIQEILQKVNKVGLISFDNVMLETKEGESLYADIFLVDRAKVLQCNVRNTTKREQTEKALLESEEKYRMLFDKALDGIALADAETGILLDCNQSLADLVGRNRAELIGQHQSILHPLSSTTKGLSPTFEQHLTKQEGQILETQVITATGEIREVEIKANLLYIQGRKMLQGIFRDITERKQAEEKLNHLLDILRKAKEEWEMTFDNVIELIVIIDKDLRIIRCNKSFAKFAGMPVSELTGKKCYDFFSCDYKQIGNCRVRAQTGEIALKNEIETESGRWFYESNCPILDSKGNFLYSVVVATDITELKNSQQGFIQAQEELKNRIKELEDFYNMAVGREIRMVELKEEIERLKEQLESIKG